MDWSKRVLHVFFLVLLVLSVLPFQFVPSVKAAAEWTTPSAIYSKCGETSPYTAIKTKDDDTGTYWMHEVTCCHWIIFDMGETKKITNIRLYQYYVTDPCCTYRWGANKGLYVYVSDNPADFGDAVWSGTLDKNGWRTSGTFDKDGRYVKLVSKHDNYHQVMYEFDAYVVPPIVAPTVTTQDASGVEHDVATLHGTITDTGGENCDQRGFDYDNDTSGEPYDYSWTESDGYGAEAFNHEITGLSADTKYYFRAKAHNSEGWGYGSEKFFTTESPPDETPPTYSDVGTNTTVAGNSCLFHVKCTDETGLATTGGYIYGTNNTGTPTNDTWVAFSSNPDWANVTKILNETIHIVVEWWVYFNDTSNNWNNTGTQSFSTTGVFTVDLTHSVTVTFSHDEAWSATQQLNWNPNVDYQKTIGWSTTVSIDWGPSVAFTKDIDWNTGLSLTWNPNVNYQKDVNWDTSLSIEWNSNVDYTQRTEWASGVALTFQPDIGYTKTEQWQATINVDYTPSITYAKDVDWITSLSLTWNPNVAYTQQSEWTATIPLTFQSNVEYAKSEQWQSTLNIDFSPNVQYSTDTTWQATVTTDFQPTFTWTLDVNHITGAIYNVVLDFLANVGWTTSLEWNSNVAVDWTPNIAYTTSPTWTTVITLNWNPTITYDIPIPTITSPSIGGHIHIITDVITVTLHPIETPDPKLIETWEGKIPVTTKITIENLLEQPQNVTVYWYVTVYGSSRILANNTRIVELDYPFNTEVTAVIRFNLPVDKELIPDLTETYKFQTEIAYYKGVRTEKTGASTLFTLSDATVQRHTTYLLLIVIGMVAVTGIVYVQRKTAKKEED